MIHEISIVALICFSMVLIGLSLGFFLILIEGNLDLDV